MFELVYRFELLKLNCLVEPVKEKLADIVTQFHRDIEHVQDVRN